MLFDPARHEPLRAGLDAFDERAIRAEIQAIVAEAEASYRGAALWLEHPDDREDGAAPSAAATSLFLGAAGTLWALHDLRRDGSATVRLDLVEATGHLLDAHARAPDEPGAPGYLLGELGVRAVAWRLTRDAAHLEAAQKAAVAATPLPALDLMWAAPGAALVARAVVDEAADAATGAAWREILAAATRHLVATLQRDEASGHWLWTQDLYGSRVRYLGAIHGFAGNAQGILAGLDTRNPSASGVLLSGAGCGCGAARRIGEPGLGSRP